MTLSRNLIWLCRKFSTKDICCPFLSMWCSSIGTVKLCTHYVMSDKVESKYETEMDLLMERNKERSSEDYYPGYRHPKSLIGYVVWQYHRFMLSLRDVSELLLMRGIVLSYKTIRYENGI